jgi:hypothetical protein
MSAMGMAAALNADQPEKIGTEKRVPLKTEEWQYHLLPFMKWFIVALTAAFFAFSAVDLDQVNDFIEAADQDHPHDVSKDKTASNSTMQPASVSEIPPVLMTQEEYFKIRLLGLETELVDKRFHLESAVLMSRIVVKQLSFITGIVMALLGALFILGKLSELPSKVEGGTAQWHVGINSASPGLILSFFGTVLLVISLSSEINLDTREHAVYVSRADYIPAASTIGEMNRKPDAGKSKQRQHIPRLTSQQVP